MANSKVRLASDSVAVTGSAPIAPGASETVEVVVAGGYRRASLAAMLICTNDGFASVRRVKLPGPGDMAEFFGKGYDAGTEMNTEDYDDLVPPCDGSGASGTTDSALAEGGVVHHHLGITGGADLVPGTHGWTDPAVKVTITRTG